MIPLEDMLDLEDAIAQHEANLAAQANDDDQEAA